MGGHFHWDREKFPQFYEEEITLEKPGRQDITFAEVFGQAVFIQRLNIKYLRLMGAVLSPFSAYLNLLGLETITERVSKEVATSLRLAKFLEHNPHVEKVFDSALLNNGQKSLVKKYFPNGIGTVFSFKLKGDKHNVDRLLNSVKVFTYLPNVGDNRSLIVNPNNTTHREVPLAERRSQHISENLIRLSIGLESADDLENDLKQAIAYAFKE